MYTNLKLVDIFREMAVLFEIKDIAFKPRAYEHAAFSLLSLTEDVRDIYKREGFRALLEIPGVGRGIAEKIEEFLKTRHVKEYDQLKKKFPVDIKTLSLVEGIGPKAIGKLYERLKIKNVSQLERACKHHRIRNLKGFGQKSEEKILNSLGHLKRYRGRFLLGEALPLSEKIIFQLEKHDFIQKVECAGSLRRRQETIGDLDFIVVSDHPSKAMTAFMKLPDIASVIANGNTKTSVKLKNGINADLRVVSSHSYGSALQYFTGDKYHNIELRKIAIRKGYKLNEYGLFKGSNSVAGKTEEEIYHKLGMSWMEPELRTNSGEIEAAINGNLPKLIDYHDLKGDLQTQTDWTDGEHSIQEMAYAARKAGLAYLAITDHTKSLAFTGGSDEKKLRRQMAEIDKIQASFGTFKILKGAEINILKNGALDIHDEVLSKLDIVGASVHSHFSMDSKDMTARIIKAMENPHVDIIFHPTGRILQRREPYQVNIDELIKAAKRTHTILEIDAHPERLDLKDEYIRKAIEVGVLLSIDSDAHSTSDFQYLQYGIAQARRGWAQKKDVVNTRPWQSLLKLLK